MVMMLAADPLVMSEEDREALALMARSPSLAHRTVLRAKALLLAADGVAIYEMRDRSAFRRTRCGPGGAD